MICVNTGDKVLKSRVGDELPHDAVVYVDGKQYIDEEWQRMFKPEWYMINHGEPNIKFNITGSHSGITIQFEASRDIEAGEEIFYEYTDAPEHWV